MAIPNQHHLFEQAERLVASPPAGAPRQVDLRRAISSAYHGAFHATLAAATDMLIGVTKRASSQYTLVYRSVDHRALRDLCAEVKKPVATARYARYQPKTGFDTNVKAFAGAVLTLQEMRHAADYDPSIRVTALDARSAIRTARSAVDRFEQAGTAQRRAFLLLLLFPPR